MSDPASHSPLRVLIIHSGALGDTILMLRMVHAMRSLNGGVVALLGRSCYRELLTPAIDRFLDLETGGSHALFSEEAFIPERLAQDLGQFDLAINVLGCDQTLERRLMSCGVRDVIHIDPKPVVGSRRHITDQWLSKLHVELSDRGLLSFDPGQIGPPRLTPGLMPSSAIPQVATNAERYVLIHPGSGGLSKCWPLDRFIALANRIRASGKEVQIVIGPAEQERFTPEERRVIGGAGQTVAPATLTELANVLCRASLFIGNDSGVSHLAAAVGAPVIAIFGPTSPDVWRPLGRQVEVVCSETGWPTIDAVFDRAMNPHP